MNDLTSINTDSDFLTSGENLISYFEVEDRKLPFYQDWIEEDERRCKRIDKFFPKKCQKKSFKEVIRQGIGKKQRNEIYLFLSNLDTKLDDFTPNWHEIIANNSTPLNNNVFTLFGCPDYELYAPKESLQKFLTVFVNHNQIDTFSPMIPSVASILFITFRPDAAYFVLQSMYDQDSKYFTKTKKEFAIMLNTIDYILSNYSRLYSKAKDLKIDFQEEALFMIPLFFTRKIDRNVSHTIFDSFFHDGRSVFIKFVVGIIVSLQPKLLQSNSAIEFMNIIRDYMFSLSSPAQLINLIHLTFHQRHSKSKKVMSCQLQEEEKISKIDENQINLSITSPLPNIDNFVAFHQYNGRNINPNPAPQYPRLNQVISSWSKVVKGSLMTEMQFHTLKSMLPYSIFGRFNAYLVYQKSVEGSAVTTFIDKCRGAKKSIILIKTQSKTIGAVLTEELSLSYRGRYTKSNTYVFDLTNNIVYNKTSNNDYCVSVENDSLSIGGGEQGIAIHINKCFENCSSYPCSTFNSPPLLAPNTNEDVQELEVYKLDV